MNDLTLWLYMLAVGASGFGVILFLTNWARLRHATRVYRYVTGILFGYFLKTSVELYSFIVREMGNLEGFLNIIHSWWWDLRLLLTILPVIALVGEMTYRYFWKRNLTSE